MGIIIPYDRTQLQQPVGYCVNPACVPKGKTRFEFPVDHSNFSCPKCGGDKPPAVGLLVLTHFLTKNPQGKIVSLGISYSLACDESRAYMATVSNLEAASGDPEAVNCEGCLKKINDMGLLNHGWQFKSALIDQGWPLKSAEKKSGKEKTT